MIKCFTDICVNSKNAFFGASDGLCFLLPSCRTRSRCARHAVQTSNSIEGSGQTIWGFFQGKCHLSFKEFAPDRYTTSVF